MPSAGEMSSAIEIATRSALEQLFNTVPESFYYCALITTGEGLAPCLAAWSWEALDRAANQSDPPVQAREWLQWSWGDSPYLAYGDEFFGPVKELFFKRDSEMQLCTDEESARELDVRLASMASALGNLDARDCSAAANGARPSSSTRKSARPITPTRSAPGNSILPAPCWPTGCATAPSRSLSVPPV